MESSRWATASLLELSLCSTLTSGGSETQPLTASNSSAEPRVISLVFMILQIYAVVESDAPALGTFTPLQVGTQLVHQNVMQAAHKPQRALAQRPSAGSPILVGRQNRLAMYGGALHSVIG